MSRKVKYTKEVKLKASKDYLSGKVSAFNIARSLGMSKRGDEIVRYWARQYEVNGDEIFDDKPRNKSYSKEFKEKVVKEYLDGKGSFKYLAAKFGIPSNCTVLSWVKKYNGHIELEDYDPKGEIYMTKGRITTLDERIEIVKWCIDHDRSIKDTASHFECSYAQVRTWLLKYEEFGEEGLIDKRGKPKEEKDLSELELAQRKIQSLEKENEKLKRMNEILKKAESLERW